METDAETKTRRFLPRMNLRRGYKHIRYLDVNLHPSPENDPRPFIARDKSGKKVPLLLREQAQAEILVLGKPTAETLDRLRFQDIIIRGKERQKAKKAAPKKV